MLELLQKVTVHIFITSYDDTKTPKPFELLEKDVKLRAHEHSFSVRELADTLNAPPIKSRDMRDTLEDEADSGVRPANKLGGHNAIYVWNGRADWDQVFAVVVSSLPGDTKYVGCCFCGLAFIGKDLKRMCKKYSSQDEQLFFQLHKENF